MLSSFDDREEVTTDFEIEETYTVLFILPIYASNPSMNMNQSLDCQYYCCS